MKYPDNLKDILFKTKEQHTDNLKAILIMQMKHRDAPGANTAGTGPGCPSSTRTVGACRPLCVREVTQLGQRPPEGMERPLRRVEKEVQQVGSPHA